MFSFSFSARTFILAVLVLLRLSGRISDGLFTVLIILMTMLVIFDLILRGTWVWGGERSNDALNTLILHTFFLMLLK